MSRQEFQGGAGGLQLARYKGIGPPHGSITPGFASIRTRPARISAGEGCAWASDEVYETSDKDRSGKYRGAGGVILPKALPWHELPSAV